VSGKSVSDDSLSANTKLVLYSSGIINPYSNSRYPLLPIIGSPDSRRSFSLKLYASTQLLSFRY